MNLGKARKIAEAIFRLMAFLVVLFVLIYSILRFFKIIEERTGQTDAVVESTMGIDELTPGGVFAYYSEGELEIINSAEISTTDIDATKTVVYVDPSGKIYLVEGQNNSGQSKINVSF